MKINILSMQDVDNYGSVLQAYSLKQMVTALGHDVRFIHPFDNTDDIGIAGSNDRITAARIIRHIINLREIRNNRKTFQTIIQFRHDNLPNRNLDDMVDCTIIGSDEVFNCLQPGTGLKTCFFGNIKNTKRIITYAASAGYTEFEMLNDAFKTAISEHLHNVSCFSVRDDNTHNMIQKMCRINAHKHLDPVVVGDFTEIVKEPENDYSDYCLVYAYGDRFSDKKEVSAINEYCKKNHLKIATVFGQQKWIKEHLCLSPNELINAFSTANCVITDTFHGAIFSFRFAHRFAIFIRNSNRNKLEDLCNEINIKEHICLNPSELEQILLLSHDADTDFIEKERHRSMEYLKEFLYENRM